MTRQPITIADVTVQPGERAYGFLHVGYLAALTEVRIPFQVLHGAHDGPTICMDAGLQGWEPMGAEILRRALLGVDPKQLRGTILCLPFVMPFGVEIGGTIEGAGGRVNPADQLDLNKVWPGKLENGWLTEQMAAVMWRDVISKADYLLDLHDGTGSCDEIPVAFPRAFPDDPSQLLAVRGGSDGVGEDTGGIPAGLTPERMKEINAEMWDMAIAFGSTVVRWRQDPVIPTMLTGWCILNGIVPLVVEAGRRPHDRRIDPPGRRLHPQRPEAPQHDRRRPGAAGPSDRRHRLHDLPLEGGRPLHWRDREEPRLDRREGPDDRRNRRPAHQ